MNINQKNRHPMNPRIGLFPGTFSPPTLGHLDIIKRASRFFDTVYVGIAENSQKGDPFFTVEERLGLLKLMTQDLPHVEVVSYDTLSVDFCQKKHIPYLIRGLRTPADFDGEYQMASANRQLNGVETYFLMADMKHAHLSSTLIREIARYGRRLHGFVPEIVEEAIFNRLHSLKQ